ncbi:hypothetical protein [Amnibacterium setariae]|uniref:Uncharacterized protein n=1 Tax=Amnibacterium setariae TaxID=2306585 RepID=A0A3A1TZT4_9MICO|nr:hypothetical protein [Amnibacterium setariae]RIX27726.1 hypothetical protein D1781_09245 [Amnibacterium setariae]
MTAIDWPAFLLVLVTALVSALVTVSLFAVGVRLLATPAPGIAVGDADGDDGEDDPTTPASTRPPSATAGAVVAFVVAAAVAVLGVALIIH